MYFQALFLRKLLASVLSKTKEKEWDLGSRQSKSQPNERWNINPTYTEKAASLNWSRRLKKSKRVDFKENNKWELRVCLKMLSIWTKTFTGIWQLSQNI